MTWQSILAIGSGGFIGAVSRAYLNGLISQKLPHAIPFGTLGVNLLGSFIMGLLFAYFLNHNTMSVHLKSFLSTGILGALTTYSTFAIESFILLHNSHYLMAFSNMSLNLFGTILMAGLGYTLMSTFLR